MGRGRIEGFRDLEVYRLGFRLAMRIFHLSKAFPAEERFELVPQIRRSSRSVCANAVEAWRRRRYPAAFVAKLTDAEAEAAETRVHLDFALACGYLDRSVHADLDRRYEALTGKLVRMAENPDAWTVGRSSKAAKKAGADAGAAKRTYAGKAAKAGRAAKAGEAASTRKADTPSKDTSRPSTADAAPSPPCRPPAKRAPKRDGSSPPGPAPTSMEDATNEAVQ